MTREGSTPIVKFMILGAGVLVLRRDHISRIVKMHLFSLLYGTWIKQTEYKVMMNNEVSFHVVQTLAQRGIMHKFKQYIFLTYYCIYHI